jgi:hypothetical protein
MHEWLEALQKSAKTTSPGVPAEELRRAETEAGVPLPGELGDLYSVFNGGSFEGEVVLFPLKGEGEQASVLEKTRKMLVGLPVAGVWRFGLKGTHRHLYTARKSALVQQGDDAGPLPEWVQALGDEDWIYATWDDDKGEARFYRSLSTMLSVLVPPVEKEEFGENTFARAIAAVQGELDKLAGGEEKGEEQEEGAGQEGAGEQEGGQTREPGYDYEEELKAADAALAEIGARLDKPAVIAADRRMEKLPKPAAGKKAPRSEKPAAPAAGGDKDLEKPAVIAADRRMENLKSKPAQERPAAPRKKAAARTAKKAAVKKAVAKKAPAKKAVAKKAPAKKAVAKKAPAKKAAAKKAPAKKAAAKKAPVKKTAAKKASARRGR